MFLFLKRNTAIAEEDVVAILNLDTTRIAPSTKEFLEFIGTKKKLEGQPKGARSAVITRDKVFFSSISSPTLAKRIQEK